MSENLENVLKQYLERQGRGSSHELCLHTELTESDISNWLAGRRALPSHKLIAAVNWLLNEGRLRVTFYL